MRLLNEFRAPWPKSLKVSSALTSALLLAVAVVGMANAARFGLLISLATILLPLAVLAASALAIVRSYRLFDSGIVVVRPGWTTVLPLAGLQTVAGDAEALRASVRLFGNGGLFVIAGWFWNRRLGRYRALATDPSRAVVLTYQDRKVLVTPHDPQQFILRVRTLLATKDFPA